MKNDELGSRMKDNYESRTRLLLPRRTYTIIRLDGKAFHTFTKGFKRPYDRDLMAIMDKTAIGICSQIQGAKFAYVQSDEISILLTDFDSIKTDAWFDGNVQKIVSISASIAAVEFRKAIGKLSPEPHLFDEEGDYKPAYFDSRVFTIPDHIEVENYFIWRQQDASRNSIQMGAQALYSQKELHKKNTSELQEMMFQKGVNWDKYTSGEKRGRAIVKETYWMLEKNKDGSLTGEKVYRTRWVALDGIAGMLETPIFTQDRDFLKDMIPVIEG